MMKQKFIIAITVLLGAFVLFGQEPDWDAIIQEVKKSPIRFRDDTSKTIFTIPDKLFNDLKPGDCWCLNENRTFVKCEPEPEENQP